MDPEPQGYQGQADVVARLHEPAEDGGLAPTDFVSAARSQPQQRHFVLFLLWGV